MRNPIEVLEAHVAESALDPGDVRHMESGQIGNAFLPAALGLGAWVVRVLPLRGSLPGSATLSDPVDHNNKARHGVGPPPAECRVEHEAD